MVAPRCGKNDTILNHLIKCEAVKEINKKEVEAEKASHHLTKATSGENHSMVDILAHESMLSSKPVPSDEPAMKCHRTEVQHTLSVVARKHWPPHGSMNLTISYVIYLCLVVFPGIWPVITYVSFIPEC